MAAERYLPRAPNRTGRSEVTAHRTRYCPSGSLRRPRAHRPWGWTCIEAARTAEAAGYAMPEVMPEDGNLVSGRGSEAERRIRYASLTSSDEVPRGYVETGPWPPASAKAAHPPIPPTMFLSSRDVRSRCRSSARSHLATLVLFLLVVAWSPVRPVRCRHWGVDGPAPSGMTIARPVRPTHQRSVSPNP
jgi:hypothetical protein